LAAVLFGNMLMRVSSGAGGVIVGLYIAHLSTQGMNGGAKLAGTLGAIAFLTELAGAVPMGMVSDALAPRILMTGGALIGALGTQGFALVGRLGILFASRSLEGFGAASTGPAILAHLTDVTASNSGMRARVMSMFELTLLGGLALGGLAGGQLWNWLGTSAFASVGAIYLLSAVLLWIGGAGSRGYGASAALSGFRRALESRALRNLVPVWLCANALAGLWIGPTVSYLLAAAPRDGQFLAGVFANATYKVGWATFFFALTFSTGITIWSFILPRLKLFNAMKYALYGMMGTCVFLFLLNHSGEGAYTWRWITGILTGLCVMVESGFTPAAVSMLANIVGPQAGRGAAMGIYSVMLGLGAISGSLLAGWLGDRFAFDGIIFGTVALGFVGMFLLFRAMRQARDER
jgi:MFS family permease